MKDPQRFDQIAFLHLRYFLAVVDEGSIRAAAEQLRISQPSLSQQITKLERRLAVRLFERSPSGMRLTEPGQQLATTIRSTILDLQALATAPALAHRIGVPRGTSGTMLNALIDRYGSTTRFVTVDSSRVIAAITKGSVDAALLRGRITDVPHNIDVRPFRTEELGVLLAESHPLAQHAQLQWNELGGQRLLWFNERRAPEHAAELLTTCHRQGWTPELIPIDPAGAAITEDMLRRSENLVALRPEPEAPLQGLRWVSLGNPPMVHFSFATPQDRP